MSHEETLFKINVGVDTYNADIAVGNSLQFKRLKNVQPFSGRLVTPAGLTLKQQLALLTPILGFVYYSEPISQTAHLFAVSTTKVYVFSFITGEFETAPVFNTLVNTLDIPCWTAWLDSAYMSKRNAGLLKMQNRSVTVVPNAPSGRYMIIADGHLMLLNTVSADGSSHPVRVQYSDLYEPEDWVVGPASEADAFELSPNDGEGTGLSYQRNMVMVYTRNRIWTARYTKGSEEVLGKFLFEVLYGSVGNVYHGALISVKEVDYFIGRDNFYSLDGSQLQEIGDPIWSFFKETLFNTNFQKSVTALADLTKHEISWTYDHVDGYRWSVVFNYKENKWSDRDPGVVYSNFFLDFPFRGYIPIADLSEPFTAFDLRTITGDWQYLDFNEASLFGGEEGLVLKPSRPASYVDFADNGYACEMETFEVDYDSLLEIKEFDSFKLLFSVREGSLRINSNLRMLVGHRSSREESITWSAPIYLRDQLSTDSVFFFRNVGVGKLVRFKFLWNNTTDWAITEIVKASLTKLTDDEQNIETT